MWNGPISTVAMTAYNWIATQSSARTLSEVAAGVRKSWHEDVEEKQVESALTLLLSKRLVSLESARYDVRDAQRRVVVTRDRSDPTGWRGWKVAKRSDAPRTLLDTEETS